jgi:hypothetical protein
MKELTATFNNLLQDKRVRAEQSKYESIQRQRAAAVNKYKRAYQEFLDLESGLQGAKTWYTEMKETVDSLSKNVETFVNNRKSEGATLLNQIEQEKAANKSQQAELERERLQGLMERMSMNTPTTSPPPASGSARPVPTPLSFNQPATPRYPSTNFSGQYQVPQSPPPHQASFSSYSAAPQAPTPYAPSPGPHATTFSQTYNPGNWGRNPGPTSPPPTQTSFNMMGGPASPPPTQTTFSPSQYSTYGNPQAQQQQQQPQSTYGNPQAHHHLHQQQQPQPQQQPPPHQQQQQQQQHMQQQPQQAQGGYGVPQNFVPPPPPPGPPPLGPQQTIHYGQDYQNQYGGGAAAPQGGMAMQNGQQQQQRNSQDPWSGLSQWQ